jgi:hypothetical protein
MKLIFVLLAAPIVDVDPPEEEIIHENGNVARDVPIASLHSFVSAQSELAPLVI